MNDSEALMHQLFKTTRIISKGLNKILEPYGLYSSEWSIITALQKIGPMTQGDLAAYLCVEPPAVSRTLVKMEQKGLIIRNPGTDKRERKVLLTKDALKQYPKWLEASQHHRNTLLLTLSPEKQLELARLLKTVFENGKQLSTDF